jgi:hypothetical protein
VLSLNADEVLEWSPLMDHEIGDIVFCWDQRTEVWHLSFLASKTLDAKSDVIVARAMLPNGSLAGLYTTSKWTFVCPVAPIYVSVDKASQPLTNPGASS